MTGRGTGEAPLRFSTDGMRAGEARDAYHALYAAGADFSAEDDRFRAVMTSRRFARLIVHDRRLRAVRHRRDAPRVRRDDFSHFTATLCLAGHVDVDDGGGYRRIRPGELLLLDMSRPTRNRTEDGHLLTVALGREVLDGVAGDARRLHGHVLDPGRALPIARYLTTLASPAARAVDGPDDAAQTTQELFRDVLIAPTGDATARHHARRRLEALRIIEADLGDPGLDAARLAARVGVSRATLYRLFEASGGVRQHILSRRLARLRDLLVTGDNAGSVAALAASVGIPGESHASRVFLDRFGLRPGEFRRMAQRLAPPERAALTMMLWQDSVR